MIPLYDVKPHNCFIVESIDLDKDTTRHLHDLGLEEGTSLFVVNNYKGDVIIEIEGVRLCINKEISKKISGDIKWL